MNYLEKKKKAMLNAIASQPTPPLPSEYQQVEWIGSSGTQYIDTGVYNTATTSYKIEFSTEASPRDTNLFGGRLGLQASSQVVYINTSTNKGIAIHYGTSGTIRIDTGWVYTSNIIDTKTKLEVENTLSDTTVTVNDNIVYTRTISKTNFTSTITSFLFGRNNIGSASSLGEFKIYTCQLFNGGVLEKDLVPCYRKSDNEVGMYDLVDDEFLTNQGSGSFTYGTEV